MKAIAETKTLGWTGWKNASAKSGRNAVKMACSGLEDAPINAWQFAYDAAHAAFNYRPELRDAVNAPHWRCWKCAAKLFVDVNTDLINPTCKCGKAGHWYAVKVPA